MTATLQRYCRQLPATKQLRQMTLIECLNHLGLKRGKVCESEEIIRTKKRVRKQFGQFRRGASGYSMKVKRITKPSCSIQKMNEWELSDLFNVAHALYRQMMAVLHPDAGGDGKFCSRLTELWMRIKQLFKRKGITG